MTRIAYVINSVEGGGAAFPAVAVIDLLRREGFEVEMLALTRRDGLALPHLARAGISVTVRDGGERDHRAALQWLTRQIDKRQPDVLWTSLTRATLLGQLIGLRRGLPVVSWQHAAFLKPANRRLLRLLRRATALWVADSERVAALTRERLNVARDDVLVWPLFRASADAPQARPWQPGETVRLGSLGRLHPVKGYDVLVEAIGRLRTDLPPFELAIAGEGDERARLEKSIASSALPIALPGFVPDPAAFLATRHLYLQPSRSEGLCVAAHEAMAAGLPVVASAVGELPASIVDGVTGRVVLPDDPAALAGTLADLLRSPEKLARMGTAGRARVLDRFGPAAFDQAGTQVSARLRAILAGRSTIALGRSAGPARSGRSA